MAEQEQDKLLIRLHVYDTDLSVRIPREDEEYYRKSAKLIDDIVNSYTKIFKGEMEYQWDAVYADDELHSYSVGGILYDSIGGSQGIR